MKKSSLFSTLTWILLSLFIVMIFSGCGSEFQHFGEFSIQDIENGCKKVTDGLGRTLVLVPRGQNAPDGYEKNQVIKIPVKKAVVYLSSDVALLKAIGALDSVAGVTKKKEDWTIPEIKHGMENGKVVYLGEYTSVDFERLKVLDPDIVFAWDESAIPMLTELDIPCVITTTKIAKDLKTRMYFIRFLAAFYDKEKEADHFIARVSKTIDKIAKKTAGVKIKPKVIWGDIYEKRVLVEPINSSPAEIILLAGGEYLFDDVKGAA
ncbi:MAG: ABC transporter substrate-binding protein [Deltaproteobacteria bacterium]|nr:ABC transporter substrate-binding protein [Deltaproteobacteria bacterium]